MEIPLRELQHCNTATTTFSGNKKIQKKVCESFENRNHFLLPLQRQNENGIGAPHQGKLFLTCTKEIAHVWPQK